DLDPLRAGDHRRCVPAPPARILKGGVKDECPHLYGWQDGSNVGGFDRSVDRRRGPRACDRSKHPSHTLERRSVESDVRSRVAKLELCVLERAPGALDALGPCIPLLARPRPWVVLRPTQAGLRIPKNEPEGPVGVRRCKENSDHSTVANREQQ